MTKEPRDMKVKKFRSLLWLLLIPAQLAVGMFFARVGLWIDLAIFSNGENGHGFPIFSAVFLLIAAVVTLAVVVIALMMTIRDFCRR